MAACRSGICWGHKRRPLPFDSCWFCCLGCGMVSRPAQDHGGLPGFVLGCGTQHRGVGGGGPRNEVNGQNEGQTQTLFVINGGLPAKFVLPAVARVKHLLRLVRLLKMLKIWWTIQK